MINVWSSSVNVRNSAASNCDDYLVEFLTPDKPWIRVQLLVLLLTDQWPLSENIMMTKSELIFRHKCIKNDVSFFLFWTKKYYTKESGKNRDESSAQISFPETIFWKSRSSTDCETFLLEQFLSDHCFLSARITFEETHKMFCCLFFHLHLEKKTFLR